VKVNVGMQTTPLADEQVKSKDTQTLEQEMLAEINAYLYKNLLLSVVSVLVLATILVWGLYGVIEEKSLVIWYSSILAIVTFRIFLLIWFYKKNNIVELQSYLYNLFVFGSSLSAALFGVMGSYLMPADVVHQTFIIIIISGLIAGAVINLGISFLGTILYVVFTLLPVIVWLGIQVWHGNQIYFGILISMSLYILYSVVSVYHNSKMISDGLKLKNQNFLLLKELKIHMNQMELFSKMEESLEKCRSENEIGKTCEQYLLVLFPEFSGGIFILSGASNRMEILARWGSLTKIKGILRENCKAVENSAPYIGHGAERCQHCPDPSKFYICIPLQTSFEFYGILHLELTFEFLKEKEFMLSQKAFMVRIASDVSIALSRARYVERLKIQSTQDSLTGLFNRLYLENYFKIELAASSLTTTMAVVMIDIDFFKKINDTYGHKIGDDVLQQFGEFLKQNVRGSDFACRYGGEEFILILPGSTLEVAQKRAEKIRAGVKLIDNDKIPKITISAGIAVFPGQGDTQEAVIEAADKAMYQAKREGRDRVCVSQVPIN